MKVTKTKSSAIIFYLFVVLFLGKRNSIFAQNNSSYDQNTIPINGNKNTGFGLNVLQGLNPGDNNSAFGNSALSNNTGSSNSAIGYKALSANISGNENTAFGAFAGTTNTTGSKNTFVGVLVNLFGSGSYNTGIGHSSLSYMSGDYNTAIGYGTGASFFSPSISNSTAIGYGAFLNSSNTIQLGNSSVTTIYAGVGTASKLVTGGLQVTGGSPGIGKVLTSDGVGNATWQNVSIGSGSWLLTGNSGTVDGTNFIGTTDNVPLNIRVNNQKAGRLDPQYSSTFYGIDAGKSNTSGTENTAIGVSALSSNTTGLSNVGLGVNALTKNNDGWWNVGVGNLSLANNTNGGANVAIGTWALRNNQDGSANTATGHGSMHNLTTGEFNTANGDFALYSNVTGQYNTAIGGQSLVTFIGGSFTTGLGYLADGNGISGHNNSTAIGANTIINASNKIRLGDAAVTVIEGTVVYTVSDGRFKKNISSTEVKGLEFINKLKPVTYNFEAEKFQEFLTQFTPDSLKRKYFEGKDFTSANSIRQSGFIAQEVETAALESGYNFNGIHIPETIYDNYSLAYSQFVVPLVKSVQELSKQNEDLTKAIKDQNEQIEVLKAQLNEIRSSIKKQDSQAPKGDNIIPKEEEISGKLFQNSPNPFNKSSIIKYRISDKASNAKITISNIGGVVIKEFKLTKNSSQSIEISSNSLSTGTYIYSLFINGTLVDSKKMIITK